MKRQTNNMKCTNSNSRADQKWSLVLAALAGVALAAGCSSDKPQGDYSAHTTTYTTSTDTAPPPAVGAAETPSGRSSGYSSSSTTSSGYGTTTRTTTVTTSERTDVITDPATLPPNNLNAVYVDRCVNFSHMKVERVVNDRFIEVSSDDGQVFYVMCDESIFNVKPGDYIIVTGIIRNPDNVSTAFDKKGAYYLMRHPFYIAVERIQIVQA